MKTEERPEISIAIMTALRFAAGKLCSMLVLDQDSIVMEQMRRMGIERRLL